MRGGVINCSNITKFYENTEKYAERWSAYCHCVVAKSEHINWKICQVWIF